MNSLSSNSCKSRRDTRTTSLRLRLFVYACHYSSKLLMFILEIFSKAGLWLDERGTTALWRAPRYLEENRVNNKYN